MLVFGEGAVGNVGGNWTLSDDDLRGLESSGLFTRDEIRASAMASPREDTVGTVRCTTTILGGWNSVRSPVITSPGWVPGWR